MKVTKFEMIHHGLEHPDYFQGCGVAFTEFDEVYTGCGDTPMDAGNDALEMAFQDNDWSDEMMARAEACIEASFGGDEASDYEPIPEDSDARYIVSIRVKLGE